MIYKEKELFSLIEKRVSIKEKNVLFMMDSLKKEIFSIDVFNKSLEMDKEVDLLDEEINAHMVKMGISDEFKSSIYKNKKDYNAIRKRLLLAMSEMDENRIPFILYHLTKQCPDEYLSKKLKMRESTVLSNYFVKSGRLWNRIQIETIIDKLYELIYR